MPKRFRNLPAVAVAVLLAACLAAAFFTRNAGPAAGAAEPAAPDTRKLPVDEALFQTARGLSSVADTPQEQALAAEALRLSDHELNQAYATALRESAAAGAPASGPLKQIADRIAQIKTRIAAGEARIARLSKQADANEDAHDEVQLAKAQLALDRDELEDAQQDLARHGGNQHARLERAREEHEAAQREPSRLPKSFAETPETLATQVAALFSLNARERDVDAAAREASNKVAALGRQHATLAKIVQEKPGVYVPPPKDEGWSVVDDLFAEDDTTTLIARLRNLSEKAKTLAELSKRMQDTQQLADVYKRWTAAVAARRMNVVHLLLGSLAWVLAVLLAAILLTGAIRRALHFQTDRRRLNQLRLTATVAVEFAAAVIILLIVFGRPNQLSTVIGLATAGLTVALKDFIVSFVGWFALMGRNGLRVGDWVEIKGVSGEVIDIGVIRTTLLEMGNWTDTGHPTGRRVAFANSFAIEGHYFNFSTAGQWLWDELQVSVPAAGDPHAIVQQIRETVDRATASDATAAEADWERVTRQYGLPPFSAKPSVELRPSARGLDVVVRYLTRAPQRVDVKSRLFERIVDLLHKPVGSPV